MGCRVPWDRPEDYVKAVVLSKLDKECGDDKAARKKRLLELQQISNLSEVGQQALKELLEGS